LNDECFALTVGPGRSSWSGEMAATRTSINNDPEPKRRSAYPYLLVGALLYGFIHSFRFLSPILLSFLLILLITLALNPLIAWLRRVTGGRKLAATLVLLGFFAVLVLTAMAAAGPVRSSAELLSEKLPEYWEQLQKPLIRMEKTAVLSEERLEKEVVTELAEEAAAKGDYDTALKVTAPAPPKPKPETATIRSNIAGVLQGAVTNFASFAFNAAQSVLVLFTVFFGVVFSIMNPRPIFESLFAMVPARNHRRAVRIMRRIGEFVPRWAGATLLGMLTIGTLVFLLMWPIFGFSDALVLGLLAGVLEIIPFLGPVLSAVPGLLLAVGHGGYTPLLVLAAYVAVQTLEGNVIQPLIMAKSMSLHPVAVIFAMLLCVAAFGVLGVLVAPPLVGVVGILHEELFRKRFLPETTDTDLEQLARTALREDRALAKRG
jgi:predicted PurR-regulated permease PerM